MSTLNVIDPGEYADLMDRISSDYTAKEEEEFAKALDPWLTAELSNMTEKEQSQLIDEINNLSQDLATNFQIPQETKQVEKEEEIASLQKRKLLEKEVSDTENRLERLKREMADLAVEKKVVKETEQVIKKEVEGINEKTRKLANMVNRQMSGREMITAEKMTGEKINQLKLETINSLRNKMKK